MDWVKDTLKLLIILGVTAAGLVLSPAWGKTIDCQPFEFEPMGQLFNKLSQACYSMHGGDKMPDGGRVVNFVLRHQGEGCGVIPRLTVLVRADRKACVWWEADEK